jgi:hypothetical protein
MAGSLSAISKVVVPLRLGAVLIENKQAMLLEGGQLN